MTKSIVVQEDLKENLNGNNELITEKDKEKALKKNSTNSIQPTISSMFKRKRKASEDNDVKPLSDKSNENQSLIEPESKDTNDEGLMKKIKMSETVRCKDCYQIDGHSNVSYYEGHPVGALSELEAMFHKNVALIEGHELERAQFKLTEFSVFCKSSHMCPFDTGLIEKNVKLYFSGYMKCIIDESTGIDSAVPMYSEAPIVEWWISGYDGTQHSVIGFSTEYAEYYLMKPSKKYANIMQSTYEKAAMSKAFIEYLLDNCETDPSYEDMLAHLQACVPPQGFDPYTEESILRHAQFICDQIASIDSCEPEETPLITLRCIRTLINLVGIKFTKSATKKSDKSALKRKRVFTKATTTAIVQEIFESFFPEQLDGENKSLTLRRKRCGVCDNCQKPDCGQCTACLAMVKFGGSGRTKKACHHRICPNMAVQEAEESDPEDEEDYNEKVEAKSILEKKKDTVDMSFISVPGNNKASWLGEYRTEGSYKYYNSCQISENVYQKGDFVMLEHKDSSETIAQIMYFYEKSGSKMFHVQFYARGSETILGSISHSKELFILNSCQSLKLDVIRKKVIVDHKVPPKNWAMLGGFKDEDDVDYDDSMFFFQKRYDDKTARFEDPDILINEFKIDAEMDFCPSCNFNKIQEGYLMPHLTESKDAVLWRGLIFSVGDAILLNSDKYDLKNYNEETQLKAIKLENVDDSEYPEYYRKADNNMRGSNVFTAQPFGIAYISEIYTKNKGSEPSDIYMKVHRLYRPENIPNIKHSMLDLNLVYWSDEIISINFLENVAGKCYLLYAGATDIDIDEWTAKGPYRFYFKDIYDYKEKKIKPVTGGLPASIGSSGKGKGGKGGKSSSKFKSSVTEKKPNTQPMPEYVEVCTPLRTLDVFAGCGGLSEGLHQSGIAKSEWAIEFDRSAASAYKLNNPDTVVLNEDCNYILRDAMDGITHTKSNQPIPLRGEVELLCGGPPCQGFSGMNRFNKLEYSLFKNSLVATYLSYCDFYRPKFFILENVRNFVAFKGGMVLKLTLRCLIAMGYQCTFGILQAGNYGVPQTRRRLIILAAAPGEKLPTYPEPSHVFNRRACTLSVQIDGKKYSNNIFWEDQAPYRTITIRDAMSDLPPISSGNNTIEQDYDNIPQSHFQRMMRFDGKEVLTEHVAKDQSALVQARISLIPTHVGADWRDLPNRIMKLLDGKMCDLLRYSYDDRKNGKSPSGLKRGVCACASKRPCNSYDRQFNTLIPWCLPHTANRHNNWAGLYGRLDWNGYFGTTITNPEPMGKQGRVLHPEQHRVVSVRECARSQGFPDCYKFYGHIVDKHRQVGNAVPPPLARAIGMEIRKCLVTKS